MVNVDWFFYSHRLPIAQEALRKGYEVHIATTITQPMIKNSLIKKGLRFHEISFDRRGGFISLIKTFLEILKLLSKLRPDILHLVTIQPILIGGIAARLTNINKVIYAISGLGHIFINQSFISLIRRKVVTLMYRIAIQSKHRVVIFQNNNDKKLLSKACCLSPTEIKLIPGSGVDLKKYHFTELPEGTPIILMASRLLISKGVREFIEAANIIKKNGIKVKFYLVGKIDLLNPLGIDLNSIKDWNSNQCIEYLGYRDDIHRIMQKCHLVVLPSYYPEGLPKVLCEAAACGRAIITTDEPGCREAIEENITGLLVPSRNSSKLAEAICKIINDKKKLAEMSVSARSRAEKFFSIESIVEKHIKIYNYLSGLI